MDRQADQEKAQQFAELAGMDTEKARLLRLESFMGFTVAYRPASSDVEVLSHSFENDIFLRNVPE